MTFLDYVYPKRFMRKLMTSKNPLKKLSLFVDLKERRGLGDKREKRGIEVSVDKMA